MNVRRGQGQTRPWGIVGWAVVFASAIASVPGVAQPVAIPPAQPRPGSNGSGAGQAAPAVQVEPSTVLDDVRKALQGVWGERVTITIKTGERTTRQGEYVLRSAPSGVQNAEGEARGRRVLIELGSLRCFVEGGEAVVHSTRHPGTYFQASITGDASAESLAKVLPILLLPTLELARESGGGEGAVNLTPLTRGVRWLSAEGNPNAVAPERAVWTLQGMSEQGPVTMVVDGQSSRVQRLVIPVSEKAPDRPGIEMVFTPTSPGEPETWKPDLSKRRRVESIAQLGSAQAVLSAGQVLNLPRMLSLAGGAVERGAVFTAGPEAAAAGGPAVVLLIVHDARPNDTKPAAADGLIAQAEAVMTKLMAEAKPAGDGPRYVRMWCVNELPEANGLEAFRTRLRSRWPGLAGVADGGVMIGGPSEELVRAMGAEMLPALVIARGDGVVRAVVPLEGYVNAPEQLLNEVRQGLKGGQEERPKPE